MDENAALKVVRQGSGSLSGLEKTENKFVFHGDENYIEYEKIVNDNAINWTKL